MSLTLVTAPAEEPVTAAEVKTHSRITGTDDDVYIALLIEAARIYVEGYINRALITQTWDWKLDSGLHGMQVDKAPLQSVTTVKYIDTDGAEQTLASSVYTVDTDTEPGRIILAYNQSWPSTRNVIQNVTVRFVAGYGDNTAVPEAIRFAILWLVDHWYEHRSEVSELRLSETPTSVKSVLWPYRTDFF